MKLLKIKIILIIPALMFAISCQKKGEESKTKTPPEIEVTTPLQDSVTLTEVYPGNLVATRQVDIMVRVDGVLTGVYAQSGDKVKKGQLLYTIEETKYRDAVEQAKATLATAHSSHDYYTRQYAAMQKAFASQAVSEMELLQTKSNLEQSQSQIENAKAALATAQMMLGYCRITAPFDGTLSLQEYDKDSYINGESTPVKINTIYNDDVLHAYISINEDKYRQIMENRKAQKLNLDSVIVTFGDDASIKYKSFLNYSAPEVDPSTGTVTLRFNLDNAKGELKSGMYAKVEVPYDVLPKALLIDDASIGTDQAGKYIYVVNDSNIVEYRHIEAGPLYQDTLRIVNKGLDSKTRYVKDALLKVKEGMKVRPYTGKNR